MESRLFNFVIVMLAIAMAVMFGSLMIENFDYQEMNWRGVLAIIVHTLLMLMLVIRHGKMALKGLRLQYPVTSKG